jgi:hypothetical protein
VGVSTRLPLIRPLDRLRLLRRDTHAPTELVLTTLSRRGRPERRDDVALPEREQHVVNAHRAVERRSRTGERPLEPGGPVCPCPGGLPVPSTAKDDASYSRPVRSKAAAARAHDRSLLRRLQLDG